MLAHMIFGAAVAVFAMLLVGDFRKLWSAPPDTGAANDTVRQMAAFNARAMKFIADVEAAFPAPMGPVEPPKDYEGTIARMRESFEHRTVAMRNDFNDSVWRLECALAEAERAIDQEFECATTRMARDRLTGVRVNIEAIRKYAKKQEISALAQRFGLTILDFTDENAPQEKS